MGVVGRLRAALGRERPPREVTAGLDRDDRVLAWATLADGEVLVASRRGLWLPDEDGRPLPWHRVIKALWGGGTLTVVEGVEAPGGVLEERQPRAYRLRLPRRLPHVVRQRVEHSVGYSVHHGLAPAGGVHVVGRRVVGRDGLTWYLVYDAGTDRDDPLVRGQAEQYLAQARESTGL